MPAARAAARVRYRAPPFALAGTVMTALSMVVRFSSARSRIALKTPAAAAVADTRRSRRATVPSSRSMRLHASITRFARSLASQPNSVPRRRELSPMMVGKRYSNEG